MESIEGTCPECNKTFKLDLTEPDFVNKLNPELPGEKQLLVSLDGDDKIALKVLDHDNHLMVLEVNRKGKIRTKLAVDKTKVGMDILVNENVNACRFINDMLSKDKLGFNPRVQFISDLEYYYKFIQSQISLMTLLWEEFEFHKRRHYFLLKYENFVYSVSELEHSERLLSTKREYSEIGSLKSLILDTSVYSSEIILKYLSKWMIDLRDVKVIIVYNSDLVTDLDSQFELRDKLYEVFHAKTVSTADIVDTAARRYLNIEAIIALSMNEDLAKTYLKNYVDDEKVQYLT